MSAHPQGIPVRRVRITSASQLPHDYSQTPGGTIFSTTPGGTRIIYDREFLLSRRDSPLARTPPANLPHIPGVTCPEEEKENGRRLPAADAAVRKADAPGGTEFEMDI